MDSTSLTRRSLLRTGLVVGGGAGLAATTATLPASAAGPSVVRTVSSGLDHPWGLDFLPDGSALVTERDTGRIQRVFADGTKRLVGTVPGVHHVGEGGLLGLAVSPGYAEDRRVYVYHSTTKDNRVGWATYGDGGFGAWTYVVTGIPRATYHHGGSLAWSSAGRLFIGCGEANNRGLAQNLRSLGGKILRVTPDGGPTVPTTSRDPRILTYGHRNPEGLAVNETGELWSSELGFNTWDELNLIVSGNNYGWPGSEGTNGAKHTRPLVQWNPKYCSPSGLDIVGQKAYVAALRGEALWVVDIHGAARGTKQRYLVGAYGRLRNVKAAPNGNLWVTTDNGGGRDRIVEVRPV